MQNRGCAIIKAIESPNARQNFTGLRLIVQRIPQNNHIGRKKSNKIRKHQNRSMFGNG